MKIILIFILDGDKREEITNRHKRIVALPGRLALEKEMYRYLQGLDDADIFFVPSSNYEEALEQYNKHKTDMELVSVTCLQDCIDYLKNR